MAGKIVADTLEHSTAGSIATSYVVDGSAKSLSSWANSADTNAFPDANNVNVSSGADNGVGIFTISYTSVFAAVAKFNYGTSLHLTTVDMAVYGVEERQTGSDKYRACDGAGPTDSEVDHARNMMTVFGDLA